MNRTDRGEYSQPGGVGHVGSAGAILGADIWVGPVAEPKPSQDAERVKEKSEKKEHNYEF